jgi:hypothetical protein
MYGGGGIAPLFLTPALDRGVCAQFHSPAALSPGKEPPVPIAQEAGWAQDPVWTPWRREKSLAPAVQSVARRYTDCAIPAPSPIVSF